MASLIYNNYHELYGNLKEVAEIFHSENTNLLEIRILPNFPKWRDHGRDPKRLVHDGKIGFRFCNKTPSKVFHSFEYSSILYVSAFDDLQQYAIGHWEGVVPEGMYCKINAITKVPFENIWQHYYSSCDYEFVKRVQRLITS